MTDFEKGYKDNLISLYRIERNTNMNFNNEVTQLEIITNSVKNDEKPDEDIVKQLVDEKSQTKAKKLVDKEKKEAEKVKKEVQALVKKIAEKQIDNETSLIINHVKKNEELNEVRIADMIENTILSVISKKDLKAKEITERKEQRQKDKLKK